MVSVSLIKVKLLTILSMVFMGLFSRLVLGFPLLFPVSAPLFHTTPEDHQFPDSGNRTSLRFMPVPRHTQKRRRGHKNGQMIEDELTFLEERYDETCFEFVGEVIEQGSDKFSPSFTYLTR
jgi:hypothetical protein